MSEIGTLLNELSHIGIIVYILCSIVEIKKILRDMQKQKDDNK